MPLPLYQVDAFTDTPFSGNPAAVCVLESQADPTWMRQVAGEMNLSETAFVRPLGDRWELRWFTPTVEVPLCGHATLATAHALWEMGLGSPAGSIRFATLHRGELVCRRDEAWITMDFPADPPHPADPREAVGLGLAPAAVLRTTDDLLLVLDCERAVREFKPDFAKLRRIEARGIIITAAADDEHRDRFQFVSRFFAPSFGIDEDPVTGSAHCALGPYWSERLGLTELFGYQASARGGLVRVRPRNQRVELAGQAVTVLRGQLDA